MGRDPRVEPRAGDVVQHDLSMYVVAKKAFFYHVVIVTPGKFKTGKNVCMSQLQWRQVMRAATIIHAEGE